MTMGGRGFDEIFTRAASAAAFALWVSTFSTNNLLHFAAYTAAIYTAVRWVAPSVFEPPAPHAEGSLAAAPWNGVQKRKFAVWGASSDPLAAVSRAARHHIGTARQAPQALAARGGAAGDGFQQQTQQPGSPPFAASSKVSSWPMYRAETAASRLRAAGGNNNRRFGPQRDSPLLNATTSGGEEGGGSSVSGGLNIDASEELILDEYDLDGAQDRACSLVASSECAGGGRNEALDRLNEKVDGGLGTLVLVLATCLSMGLANSAHAGTWLNFWSGPSGLNIGGHMLSRRGVVNEILMSFFFWMVGLQLKMELVDGSLASLRGAALPCIAALGGMIVPMLVYSAINVLAPAGGSLSGVAIPMATDIAFAMGVFNLFRRRFPTSVSTFLLTLATVDDLGAIAVIASCFGGKLNVPYLAMAAAAQTGLLALERRRVSKGWAFLGLGTVLWYCLMIGGINADIAGVLTGLSVFAAKDNTFLVEEMVRPWVLVCGLLIMPIFALANTAIPLVGGGGAAATGVLGGATSPVSMGVFAGLLLGKPLGIIGFSMLAIKLGVGRLPADMTMRHLSVIGLLGAIGFTMCIFMIEQSLAMPIASGAKLAVMAASIASAAISAIVMAGTKRTPPRKDLAKSPTPAADGGDEGSSPPYVALA